MTLVVCDNTFAAAIRGKRAQEQQIKVKHSRYSRLQLADAHEALALVHQTADDFAAEVAELTTTTVTEA